MVLQLTLSPEIEAKLAAKAAAEGVDVETFARRAIESAAVKPTLDEILAPLRDEVASMWTEEELTQVLEEAKHEMRAMQRQQESP